MYKSKNDKINEAVQYLSPKIDIQEKLKNGYITADDYLKSLKSNGSI